MLPAGVIVQCICALVYSVISALAFVELCNQHVMSGTGWLVIMCVFYVLAIVELGVSCATSRTDAGSWAGALSSWWPVFQFTIYQWATQLLFGLLLLVFFVEYPSNRMDDMVTIKTIRWYSTMFLPVFFWPSMLVRLATSIQVGQHATVAGKRSL